MAETERGKVNYAQIFGGGPYDFSETDPGFYACVSRFALDEVMTRDGELFDEKTRFQIILAALIGSRSREVFAQMLPEALRRGVAPEEVREMLYQSAAYIGLGAALPLLKTANEVMAAQGISLPLPDADTGDKDRLKQGSQAQIAIFGEGMRGFAESGPAESRHINRWLAENCFGDYYTRSGLDLRRRELLTFCFLAAQGGCEPQLTSHAAANLRMGCDKGYLIAALSQCLPYIGYPRSLNALRCVNEAAAQQDGKG